MTTYKTPIAIGIFQEEIRAKEAVDALRTAGFRYDQVGVAIQSSQHATSDLEGDLVNLGVPQEQANYYDSEYQTGHIVVSIRPDGREEEAQDILSSNGAYNYENQHAESSTEQTQSQEQEDHQPVDTTHEDSETEQTKPS